MSPAIASAAALARAHGAARELQFGTPPSGTAVPVGETYQVAAPATRVSATTAKKTTAKKAEGANSLFISRGQFPGATTLITESGAGNEGPRSSKKYLHRAVGRGRVFNLPVKM